MPLEQALAGLLLVATGAVDKEIGWLPDDHHHDVYDGDDYDCDDGCDSHNVNVMTIMTMLILTRCYRQAY